MNGHASEPHNPKDGAPGGVVAGADVGRGVGAVPGVRAGDAAVGGAGGGGCAGAGERGAGVRPVRGDAVGGVVAGGAPGGDDSWLSAWLMTDQQRAEWAEDRAALESYVRRGLTEREAGLGLALWWYGRARQQREWAAWRAGQPQGGQG